MGPRLSLPLTKGLYREGPEMPDVWCGALGPVRFRNYARNYTGWRNYAGGCVSRKFWGGKGRRARPGMA